MNIVVLATILSLFGCEPSNQLNQFDAKVIRISDGDTIVVQNLSNYQKEKIRIFGIDTPEKFKSEKLYKQAKKCGVDIESIIYLGKLASKHAHIYLYDGEKVKVISFGKGRYGRVIGKVKLPNGDDYGLDMVRDGYACVYWKQTDKEYVKEMKKAEKEHKGLWKINPSLMHCLCY
jgi:micrococcal nuclease